MALGLSFYDIFAPQKVLFLKISDNVIAYDLWLKISDNVIACDPKMVTPEAGRPP